MQSTLPWNESILFLRNKGESARAGGLPRDIQVAESVFYRLIVLRGIIVNEDGRAAIMGDESTSMFAPISGRSFQDALLMTRDAAP